MTVIRLNNTVFVVALASVALFVPSAVAQSYDYHYPSPDPYQQPGPYGQAAPAPARMNPMANLQYDERDAERILWEQMARTHDSSSARTGRSRRGSRGSRGRGGQPPVPDQQTAQTYQNPQNYQDQPPQYQNPPPNYGGYYDHRVQGSDVGAVMAEARNVSSLITRRNGKAFLVIDKRNFQFYLYDANGKLLRIGPVAVGKGTTRVGAFETPTGIFPIKQKKEVDDWVRPDWYFIEEGERVPPRYEDRRVPGFFRYKMVVQGSRYIHYAEATGGRLTHGCLGLDWEDAEAVFHTMDVGSYCIVVDDQLLDRLARGEWPLPKPDEPRKPDEVVARPMPVTPEQPFARPPAAGGGERRSPEAVRNLW